MGALVRQLYVGMRHEVRLATLRRHCCHAQDIIRDKVNKQAGRRDADLHKAALTMYSGPPPAGGRAAALDSLPKQLWAENKYDVGLTRGCEPVVITPKSSFRPCQKQYPLKQEAVAGITPVFHSLLKAGVIVPCPSSPVRTPLFPVKKIRGPGEPVEWRFVQDLQAVNRAVVPRSPTVPNPHTILSQIPSTATFFSVIDLSNAFFSVPVHPDSQYWFAFEFEGKPYTFTRLCQGYCESPTIYNAALRDSLSSLVLSPGSVLLQYVDDLLVCAPTEEQCQTDTLALLRHLCEQGHKTLFQIRQTVKEALPRPAEGPLHRLNPGDWILVKDFRRKHWKARRWLGPFQVLLVTHTAVKVAERATWIHASHCKLLTVPPPAPTADLPATGQNNP
ncbi:uncharacterized protein LOC115403325 [Salarias fasciatus]|uniref:uncharacterized protein LOC115403325 n=1 Tax=Salarias fasciatus TaxID=181472 RepID=UPI00117694B1|nr:uncharacterized protein LOC115403325 [Salarias fasciatus]